MPATILNSAASHLSGRKDFKRARRALGELHKAPAGGQLATSFNNVYIVTVSLYREFDYIDKTLLSKKVSNDDILVIERVISRFLEIEGEAERGIHKFPRDQEREAYEEMKPFANFYAGVFALARGENDKAFDFFTSAGDRWEKASVIANLILSENTEGAETKLGRGYALIKSLVNTSAQLPAAARPMIGVASAETSPTIDPAQIEAEQAEHTELLSQAEDAAMRGNNLTALSLFIEALALKDNAQAKQKATAMKGGLYQQIRREESTAKKLGMIKALLSVKEDEANAHLMAAEIYAELKDSKQMLNHARRARELMSPEDSQRATADYYFAFGLYSLEQNAEALSAMPNLHSNHPLFVKAARVRLILFERLKRGEEGKTFLREVRSFLKGYTAKGFEARFLRLEGGLENLDRAHGLALEASREANEAGAVPAAIAISQLATDLVPEISEARAERARRVEAEPKPKPEPKPEAPKAAEPPPRKVVKKKAPPTQPVRVESPPQVAKEDARVAELEADIAALREKLSTGGAKIGELEAALRVAEENRVEEATRPAKEILTLLRQASGEIGRLKQQVAGLEAAKRRVAELESALQNKEGEVEALTVQHDRAVREARQQIEALNRRISSLERLEASR